MNSSKMFEIKQKIKGLLIKFQDESEFCKKFNLDVLNLDIQIMFDLKGHTAGRAICDFVGNEQTPKFLIRLNNGLFEDNQQYFFEQTIPHETAHIISYHIENELKVRERGHGLVWIHAMEIFGAKPNKYHNLKSNDNRHTPWKYTCKPDCDHGGFHYLGHVRHRGIQNKGMKFRCLVCKTTISFVEDIRIKK